MRRFPFEKFLTPKGLCRPAQGYRTRLPWERGAIDVNPNGVAACMDEGRQEEGMALVSGGEYATRNAPTVASISDARSYVCVIAIRCVHATPSTTPLGLERTRQSPRVAVLGNPGLSDATPLGLTDTAGRRRVDPSSNRKVILYVS